MFAIEKYTRFHVASYLTHITATINIKGCAIERALIRLQHKGDQFSHLFGFYHFTQWDITHSRIFSILVDIYLRHLSTHETGRNGNSGNTFVSKSSRDRLGQIDQRRLGSPI